MPTIDDLRLTIDGCAHRCLFFERRSLIAWNLRLLALAFSLLMAATAPGQDRPVDQEIRLPTDNSQTQLNPQSDPANPSQQNPPASAASVPQPQPPPQAQATGNHRHHLIELTSNNWHPLKSSEKFELFWRDLAHPMTHFSLAADAAISFATDDRSYLGSGARGYFKRYGLNAADEVNYTFMQAFLFPTLFREDPRYIPMEHGTSGQRAIYALSRIFVTRRDNGTSGLNKSHLIGTLSAVALSNAYYPSESRNRSTGANLTRVAIALATDAAFNEFKEFWPDFARKVRLNLWLQNLIRTAIRDAIRVD